MATILLKSKLQLPPAHSEQVIRQRLFTRLDAGLAKKLTLVSAPPGFGKTTLVGAWVKAREIPIAWVSLDKEDNNPQQFWPYLVASLQTLDSRIGEESLAMLCSSPPPSNHTPLSILLNEIEEIQTHFVLVLDDYQWINNGQIQDDMIFLLEHIPQAMHVLVSTRSDPPWPLAQLRARGEMIELRVDDLRFGFDETTAFLNTVMNLNLSHEDILALDARTEGWIVGLQMSALSMRGRVDKSEFISSFTGSHRFILDYLAEEVLDRQSAPVREFLLKTSLLDRMTGSLCDAILDRQDSQNVLKQLEEANLFVLPLDDERHWYRYHHLFADILRGNLKRDIPDQVHELHHQASLWYAKYGMLAEAANHAFLSGDPEFVAQLIEENALIVIMVLSDHLPDLVTWLDGLPEELLHSHPWLIVARAWVLAYSGELDAAEAVIQGAEKLISSTPAGTPDGDIKRENLAGYLAAIRGYCFFMTGDISRAAEWMEKAILHLPRSDAPTRVFSTIVLAAAIGMKGDLKGGIRVLSESASLWRNAANPLLPIMVLCELAALQILSGQLKRVIATCEEALHLSNDYYRLMGIFPPNVGFGYTRLGYVLREQNDLDAAIRYGQEAVNISANWGQKDSLSMSYMYLALSLQAAGETGAAMRMMEKGRQVSRNLSSSVDTNAAAYEAKLHAEAGDFAFIARWSELCGLSGADELAFHRAREYIVYARALLIQGKVDESLALIKRLLPLAQDASAVLYEIELLILQAIALHTLGEEEQAMLPFERALLLAEPEGLIRIFIDEGGKIQVLLRQAAHGAHTKNYAARLLAVLEASLPARGREQSMPAANLAAGYNDTLTHREIEILRMLVSHRSITEIAAELCIATSTLRTHIRNIYDKLGVHSRIEAITIAREMNLS